MSMINRRALVVGCFVIPLAGCSGPNRQSFTAIAGRAAPTDIRFKNPGNWVNIGNSTIGDTWVFVVTGPVPTPA